MILCQSFRRIAASVLLLVTASCGDSSYVRGAAVGVPEEWATHLRIAWGASWVLPAVNASVEARDRTFKLPAAARVATAFADLNHNGILDQLSEPARPCVLDQDWSCTLKSSTISIHRIQRAQGAIGSPLDRAPVNDESYVVAEVYDPATNASDRNASLCLDGSDDVCAEWGVGPYLGVSGDALVLGLCPSEMGAISLRLKSSTGDHTLRSRHPMPMNLEVETAVTDSGLLLRGHASLPIDRLIVFIIETSATEETERVLWTSETARASLELKGHDFSLVVPKGTVDKMGSHDKLMVQALSRTEDSEGGVFLVSEGKVRYSKGEIRP